MHLPRIADRGFDVPQEGTDLPVEPHSGRRGRPSQYCVPQHVGLFATCHLDREREAAIRNKFIFLYIRLSVPGHNGSSQTMHRSSTLAQYNGVSPKAAMLGGDIRLNALIKFSNAFVQHWLPRQDALRY